MKLRHRYLNPVIVFLAVYIFGLWMLGFCLNAVRWVHTYLNHLMPRVFPIYNPIYDPDSYAKLEKIFNVISIFLAIFLINFIALKLDNKKYERVVSLTDGQYTLRDGLELYFREFWLSDIITALILPVSIVAATYFIPDNVLGYFGLSAIAWLGYNMRLMYGFVPTVVIVALFSSVSRLLSIPLCVRSWRAAWLSDI